MPRIKYAIFAMASFMLGLLFSLSCLEIFLLLFMPQPMLSPNFIFSTKYHHLLPKNSAISHNKFREWEYRYTTNEFGLRGNALPISDRYDKQNIVVLGDSYSFGIGVNDGEEYPAILREKLSARYNVINLAVPGWGLTQEIREFYELGVKYNPKRVILQFCHNDVIDNMAMMVTGVEDGQIVFYNLKDLTWLSHILLDSYIQRSQVYSLFVLTFWEAYWRLKNNSAEQELIDQIKSSEEANIEAILKTTEANEYFYSTLLDTFVKDLTDRGIKLYMIAVNNELKRYPFVTKTIRALESKNNFEYIEVTPWFEGVSEKQFASPEGHRWGKVAHKILGEHLPGVIVENGLK